MITGLQDDGRWKMLFLVQSSKVQKGEKVRG
jgi:hypothetical protein